MSLLAAVHYPCSHNVYMFSLHHASLWRLLTFLMPNENVTEAQKFKLKKLDVGGSFGPGEDRATFT